MVIVLRNNTTEPKVDDVPKADSAKYTLNSLKVGRNLLHFAGWWIQMGA